MSSLFSTGDWAAVAGVGPRKLSNVHADGSVTFREDEADKRSEVTLGADEAKHRIRPLVSKEVAEALRKVSVEAAQPNSAASEYERSKAYRGALKGNDLRLMLDTLRGIYRHPNAGYPEEQNQPLLEAAVFGELGEVLGVKPGTLKSAAKKAAGGSVIPDRSAELASWEEIPEFAAHESMGAFAVERTLSVGESASGQLELPARPGIWFAYFQDGEELADDEADEAPASKLVVIHAEVFPRIAQLQTQLEPDPTKLPIDGASMAVVDADSARDKSFLSALEYAAHEIVQGRGVQVRLDGDGHGIAHVARENGQAIFVSIDLQ